MQDGPVQLIADVDADKIHPRKAASDGAGQLAKPNHVAAISQRKLKAIGKTRGSRPVRKHPVAGPSRRNAITHGLFVSHRTDFEALDENPQEYEDLLNGLWSQYQPVGRGEEIEVERIALCYWRLKRAWRHENAVSLVARRDFVRRELAEQEEYCKERDKEEEAVILQLQSAKKELDDTGEISQELKQRIFALMPGFEALWLALEKAAQERVRTGLVKNVPEVKPANALWVLATCTVTNAIALHEQLGKRRWTM